MPTAESTDRARTAVRLLMVVALYAVPVVVAVRPVGVPVFEPDVWWHLATGRWVVEHASVPVTDPFSRLDQPWVAYSWLYEVVLFFLHKHLGLAGIVVYRVALALAVVAAVHRLVARREPRFLVATGLTAAGALAVAGLFSERPWLFSILFTTLTLDAVLDLRSGRHPLLAWLLPVVYVLWANIHIQFVYGLFVLALACAAPWVNRVLGRSPNDATAATPGTRAWWALAVLSAACFLATFCNPYHVRLYGVVLEYAGQPGPFRFVNELRAMEFREPGDWVVLALAGAAAFALGRRRNLSVFDLVLPIASACFAFRARRDLWFVVVTALAILSTSGNPAGAAERFALTWPRRALVACGVAGLIVFIAVGRRLSPANLEAKVAEVFPARAAAVVAERACPGPLFNDFNWGGYLIWSLPHLPVAVDGRTNLHGDERLTRIGATWAGLPGWHDDPDVSAAGVVIAPADSPLASLLRRNERFRLEYTGEIACVFVARRTPGCVTPNGSPSLTHPQR
jgi:hypothetical protein